MHTKIGIYLLLSIVLIISGCSKVPLSEDVSTPGPLPVPSQSAQPNIIVITPTQPSPPLISVPDQEFCENPQVKQVLLDLTEALVAKDGSALAELIDPAEGLDLFYTFAGPPAHLSPDAVAGIFESEFAYSWGDQPGSGLPVEGTFTKVILPLLLDVFDRDYNQACQTLETGIGTGPTTALVQWPVKYMDMPYLALYRASGPGENELDWRTWAVGFTVVKGVPKVRILVQYFWEI